MEKNTLKLINNLKQTIKEHDKIVLISHFNPDGDAIGSALGFYHYLKKKGKNAQIIIPNKIAQFLQWMPGLEEIIIYSKSRNKANQAIENSTMTIHLDFNMPDRMGEAEKKMMSHHSYKILIDHHPHPSPVFDLQFSDITVSSTSELVYHLIKGMNEQHLVDQQIASCLFTGIMTDTGSFIHNSSSPETFHVVSALLETGINKNHIYHQVYDNYSLGRVQLLGLALKERLVYLEEYNTAYIYLTQKDLKKHNYQMGDTEGFVNYPLQIKGLRFCGLFIEQKDYVKLSFRSKGQFPANAFADKHFKGGGHLNAAGGESRLSIQETIKHFEEALPIYKDQLTR